MLLLKCKKLFLWEFKCYRCDLNCCLTQTYTLIVNVFKNRVNICKIFCVSAPHQTSAVLSLSSAAVDAPSSPWEPSLHVYWTRICSSCLRTEPGTPARSHPLLHERLPQLRLDRPRRAAAGVLPGRRGPSARCRGGERPGWEPQSVSKDGDQAPEKDVMFHRPCRWPSILSWPGSPAGPPCFHSFRVPGNRHKTPFRGQLISLQVLFMSII